MASCRPDSRDGNAQTVAENLQEIVVAAKLQPYRAKYGRYFVTNRHYVHGPVTDGRKRKLCASLTSHCRPISKR